MTLARTYSILSSGLANCQLLIANCWFIRVHLRQSAVSLVSLTVPYYTSHEADLRAEWLASCAEGASLLHYRQAVWSEATESKVMSRKPALIKLVNLEEGMPKVEQARLRMQFEVQKARAQGYAAVKLIHGYGSSGVGGALRDELQQSLRKAARDGTIAAFIAGEDWRISDEATWDLLKKYPEWKQDSDMGKDNRGISIVVL